jgi:hypothetical protein
VALNFETRSGFPVEPSVVVRWRSSDYCGHMDILHSTLGWEERAIVVEPIHDPFSTQLFGGGQRAGEMSGVWRRARGIAV